MPDTDRTDVLIAKVCNADYVLRIPLKREKAPGDDKGHEGSSCLFAGFAGAADLPTAALAFSAPDPTEQLRVATFAAFLLARTAYLTPPPQGPPVGV